MIKIFSMNLLNKTKNENKKRYRDPKRRKINILKSKRKLRRERLRKQLSEKLKKKQTKSFMMKRESSFKIAMRRTKKKIRKRKICSYASDVGNRI